MGSKETAKKKCSRCCTLLYSDETLNRGGAIMVMIYYTKEIPNGVKVTKMVLACRNEIL